MEVFGYRKLIAYQKAKEVVKKTYKFLKKFPAEERYAMCDQLRRASVSITSNIAEGVNRFSVKDKAHFIEMAYGSLMEVSSQFESAEELGYVTADDRFSMDQLIEEDARLLSGLLNSYKPSDFSKSWELIVENVDSVRKLRVPPAAEFKVTKNSTHSTEPKL